MVRQLMGVILLACLPAGLAAEGSLRGSSASMLRQHDIALDEELTFYRTPQAVLAEVEAGTLTPLTGNDDYRVANVSFAYAVPEVRMFVERLASQYRNACGEPLVVTSLTRPKIRQPRNAHALSVHPAGMAVDLRVSKRPSCRRWIEGTLLSLEQKELLDVTRERTPPHYHIAVFPSAYRAYVNELEAQQPTPEIAPALAPADAVPAQTVIVRTADFHQYGEWAVIVSTVSSLIALALLSRGTPRREA